MPKATLEQKIKKTQKAIATTKIQIEADREKLKTLEKDLKLLTEEKDKLYAAEFLKMITEKGFTTDEQKRHFLQQIEKISDTPSASVPEETDNSSVLIDKSDTAEAVK